MPASAALEVQGWLVQTLKADPAVQAICGPRVYDRVPEEPVFPYISIGPSTETNESPDCMDSAEVFMQVDGWSREVGFPEAKKLSAAVHGAVHDKDVSLPVNACCYVYHTGTQFLRDPDGLTSHAVIQLEAYVERRP